jgi:hypothetical protein
MSDPENFLSRWSRRKREPEEAPKPAADVAPATPTQDGLSGDEPVTAGSAQQAPEPAFDPASLPPIDSIGAETDISAFLKANVPSPLRLAALRRAWLADPAIRDFKGMAEYDWDFTAPGSMPGFGEMDPATDVQKMLTELFGDKPLAQEAAAELPNPPGQIIPQQEKLSGPMELESSPEPAADVEVDPATQVQTADNKIMVQREENIAAQDKTSDSDDSQIKRRRSQGSALPQ